MHLADNNISFTFTVKSNQFYYLVTAAYITNYLNFSGCKNKLCDFPGFFGSGILEWLTQVALAQDLMKQ